MDAVVSSRHRSTLRILLLDDSQGSQARRTLLLESGYPSITVVTLAEALRRLSAEHFDIVIADHPIPTGDPAWLVQQLRKARPCVAVILISAYVEALGLCETSTGADIVIQKSCLEAMHLTRAVARLRRRKPARKPPMSAATPVVVRHKTL